MAFYGGDDIQAVNASIWSTTSMLLDDCEQVVAQLRKVRAMLEREDESPKQAMLTTRLKRRGELLDLPQLPQLPSITEPFQYISTRNTVKRVRVLSPEDSVMLDRSTPLRFPRACEYTHDQFQSPTRKQVPAVVISSDSE